MPCPAHCMVMARTPKPVLKRSVMTNQEENSRKAPTLTSFQLPSAYDTPGPCVGLLPWLLSIGFQLQTPFSETSDI